MNTLSKRIFNLVLGGIMVAMATVLGFLKLYEAPYGGAITVCSMLPILFYSYRCGLKWGLGAGLVHSVLQLLLGMGALKGLTVGTLVGSILLDYILAFTVLGLAWYIARPFPSSKVGRAVGAGVSTFVVCVLRYVCSVLSGYVVWKDYDYAFDWMTNFGWGQAIEGMAENALCWLYSIVYNATYMIPEALFTVAAAVVLMLAAPKLFDARAKL